MNEIYAILMREVNKETGQIAVVVCERGTKEFVSEKLQYLKMRSLFNQELSFYIALQENEKEVIKQLKKKIVKESNLYAKVE